MNEVQRGDVNMPLLYLAKVNLNSKIFDVYDKKLKIKDVCDKI